MSRSHCVFEYLYRDAGNFKTWGTVLLTGEFDTETVETIRDSLDCGEFFVAEQVGLPVLHAPLLAWSDGPTVDDHAFHEFFALREATPGEIAGMEPWGDVSRLLDTFRAARGRWRCSLSPLARPGG